MSPCLVPNCEDMPVARGLCRRCYQNAHAAVMNKKTTWDELIAAGLLLPKGKRERTTQGGREVKDEERRYRGWFISAWQTGYGHSKAYTADARDMNNARPDITVGGYHGKGGKRRAIAAIKAEIDKAEGPVRP